VKTVVPRPAPAAISIDRVSNIMRSANFGPALIQRQFEWTRSEAKQLLNNLERAHQRTEPKTGIEPSAGSDEDSESLADLDGEQPGEAEATPPPQTHIDIVEDDIAIADDTSRTDAPPLQDFFIGNIILRRAAVNRYEIYDGLQRLTTLTILFAVLRDQVRDEDLRRELEHHVKAPDGFRLTLYGKDKTLVNHVQQAKATLRTTKANAFYDIGRRVLYVKNALRGRVENWNLARKESFARFLLESVWVSVLTVPDQRMAQEMFVNTNLYGKPLDVIDVLKGQLVELVSQSESEEELTRFTAYWTAARQEAGDRFTETLRAFDAIERQEIQSEAWPTDLGLYVAKRYSAIRIRHFQRRLWAHMKAWKECRRILSTPGESPIERDLWRLHVFWWPEWHPLALKWWVDVFFARQDKDTWEQSRRLHESRFNRLHRRCMAITLADFSETDRQKIFRNALRQDADGKDVFAGALYITPHQRRKVDRMLRSQIHSRDTWAPLTRWLEMARWQDDLPNLLRKANTEHVRPRSVKWEEDDTADMQAYNEGCFSLGNLALISRGANAGMLNDSFAAKLPVLQEEATKFWMVKSVVQDDHGNERSDWDNTAIMARAQVLRDEVWSELKMKPPS